MSIALSPSLNMGRKAAQLQIFILMFSLFKPKNATYKMSHNKETLIIKDNVKFKFLIEICLMIFPLFYFSVFVLLNQYHFIFTILIVGLIALSIVYTLLMFTTQVTSKEIATEDIDHLLYRDTVRVQQTSIKLKNGKYRNVIFETTAARNTFVHFMREESFEVMAVDRWLPLLPLNY